MDGQSELSPGGLSPGGLPKGGRITGTSRTELAGRLKDRYAAGESIRSLAESTGRSYGFVHTLLGESQVPLRGRGGPNRRRKTGS